MTADMYSSLKVNQVNRLLFSLTIVVHWVCKSDYIVVSFSTLEQKNEKKLKNYKVNSNSVASI